MARLVSRWRNLVHRNRVDRDLDEELGAAFELLVDERVGGGMPPDAAWMAAGLLCGALGVAVVVQLLRGWLFGVPPFDPIALGGAVAILIGCATVALLIPVRRATRVDPMAALRAE